MFKKLYKFLRNKVLKFSVDQIATRRYRESATPRLTLTESRRLPDSPNHHLNGCSAEIPIQELMTAYSTSTWTGVSVNHTLRIFGAHFQRKEAKNLKLFCIQYYIIFFFHTKLKFGGLNFDKFFCIIRNCDQKF